jgi:predicted extracellular nuclease
MPSRLARCVLLAAACCGLASTAFASPSGVVISEFRVRGPAGGNDEFVEIRNTAAAAVDISGWRLQGCQSGTPGTASNRTTVGTNVVLQPGQHYLFTNSSSSGGYSGSVAGDATFGTGITDFAAGNYAGIRLLDAGGAVQDGVGALLSPCREGNGLVTPTTNSANNAFHRTEDTNNNAFDFTGPQASDPQASGGIEPPCTHDGVRIFAIQGAGHVSPYNGQCVKNIPGIVTQVTANGFFMQDGDGDGDTATSDGIFVFTASAPTVAAGAQVRVRGNVSEFRPGSTFGATNCPASENACGLTITEIISPVVTAASGLFTNTAIVPVVLGSAGRIPPSRVLDNDTAGSVEAASQTLYDPAQDAIDFYESLEGMQVQVNAARAVAPINGFGEVWVVGDAGAHATNMNARGGITLVEDAAGVDYNPERILVDISDVAALLPAVSVGDTMSTATGGLTYGFGNFRIQAAALPAFASGGLARATSTVAMGPDRLRIASYNVENLDPNDADSCDGRPDRDVADGRFARIAAQVTGALLSPDIIGIEELQDDSGCANDGTVSSALTLATLVDAIVAAGGPRYTALVVDPVNNADGGAPGANIRTGILYDAARVAFVPGTVGVGDSTTPTAPVIGPDGKLALTHSPGRIDPANVAWSNSRKPLVATFDFNGRRVMVVVNHFNSKGGDAPLFGRIQPPPLSSEAQRLQQAAVEHAFIRAALVLDGDARIVTLGDFNDFEFSAPLRTLTGAASGNPILTGLASLLPPQERYSYVFEGNSQELDHMLVTAALLPGAEFQAVHVNAEFADQISDHDPLIASLRIVPPAPVADAGADQSVTHLSPVTLDASASRAGDGTSLTYRWVQVEGETVELLGADTAVATFKAPAKPSTPGKARALVFQVTVTDRFGATAVDSVVVEVVPGKPGG